MRDIILCNVNFILSSNGVRQFLKDASTETEQTEGIFEIFYRLGLGFFVCLLFISPIARFSGAVFRIDLGSAVGRSKISTRVTQFYLRLERLSLYSDRLG